jgi:hypothetical protein
MEAHPAVRSSGHREVAPGEGGVQGNPVDFLLRLQFRSPVFMVRRK